MISSVLQDVMLSGGSDAAIIPIGEQNHLLSPFLPEVTIHFILFQYFLALQLLTALL
jgi:hypothetical protein